MYNAFTLVWIYLTLQFLGKGPLLAFISKALTHNYYVQIIAYTFS